MATSIPMTPVDELLPHQLQEAWDKVTRHFPVEDTNAILKHPTACPDDCPVVARAKAIRRRIVACETSVGVETGRGAIFHHPV